MHSIASAVWAAGNTPTGRFTASPLIFTVVGALSGQVGEGSGFSENEIVCPALHSQDFRKCRSTERAGGEDHNLAWPEMGSQEARPPFLGDRGVHGHHDFCVVQSLCRVVRDLV